MANSFRSVRVPRNNRSIFTRRQAKEILEWINKLKLREKQNTELLAYLESMPSNIPERKPVLLKTSDGYLVMKMTDSELETYKLLTKPCREIN